MARARSFGNIRKLPSGRYQARCWRLGKQIAADSTFANKTDARRWLATVEADMVRGHWIDPDAGCIPFGEYATRWVAERPVRPRTREIYEGQPRHIVAVFEKVHLCDVHPVDVRTWHGRLAASGLHHNTVAKMPYQGEFADDFGTYDSLADLIRQIGYDERLHKIESEQNMLAPRFG